MLLKVFLTTVLILFTVKLNQVDTYTAKTWRFQNCSIGNLADCGRVVMLYGQREITLPDNERDMKPHCAEEKSAVRCVYKWNRQCLSGIRRQLLQLLMRGAARNIKERCDTNGTRWYLANAKCVIDSFEVGHDCMDIFTSDLALIRRNPDKNQWIPAMCCFADKWMKCFNEAREPHCDDQGKQFLDWCVHSYLGDIFDLGCNKELAFGSKKCNQILRKVPKRKKPVQKQNGSIIADLYRLFLEVSESEALSNTLNFGPGNDRDKGRSG